MVDQGSTTTSGSCGPRIDHLSTRTAWGILSMGNGIGGIVVNPAAYGGYAATPSAEALLMAQRNNPFRYLLTGENPEPTAPEGYAGGGIAGLGNAAGLLDLFMSLGGLGDNRRGTPGYAGGDAGTGGGQGNGTAARSGADWGPSAFGGDGLSPGRSAGIGLATSLAGQAIPGAGMIGTLGQGFNSMAQGMQTAQGIAALRGDPEPTGLSALGTAISSALGFGPKGNELADAATKAGISPDDAAQALGQYGYAGVANLAAGKPAGTGMEKAAAAYAAQQAMQAAMPGYGIAGLAGAAVSGISDTGLNVGPSAPAFGGNFAGNVTGAVGRDGVASISGNPAGTPGGLANMAGVTANDVASTATGGNASGANGGGGGGSGGGNANGGGASGNGGDNGSGDGANARGGRVGFAGGGRTGGGLAARLAKGSGLVPGMSGGRADRIGLHVPRGSYVVPADVVSGMGQGNTDAGGKLLARMMPRGAHRFAAGGIAGEPPAVPIQVSAGEFVVHPAHVAALGGGNPQAGADALDRMVQGVRQSNAAVAQGMPAPR